MNDVDYEDIFYKCTEEFYINNKDLDAINRNLRGKFKKNLKADLGN